MVAKDPAVRKKLAKESHLWFTTIYFKDHTKYDFADFHKDLFRITEDPDLDLGVITAFRNSGKSTIFTLSYPIWAIIGEPQKKFVMIVTLTQRQAKQIMTNIRTELETNVTLKKEIGPFESKDTEWGAYSIILNRHKAKIMVLSMEQSIRGIRHGANRPDLIILDDVEDLATIKNPDIRDKTWDTVTSSILPAGSENLKVIVIGSKLHEDGVIMRFRKEIDAGIRKKSRYIEVPIVYSDGRIAWPDRFKTMDDVEQEKRLKTGGNESAWRREYLNEIVNAEDAIIFGKDIHRYKDLPPFDSKNEFRFIALSVDPAISTSSTADCTAITILVVHGYAERLRIRIYTPIINEKLEGPDIIKKIKGLYLDFETRFKVKPKIFIESVGGFIHVSQSLKRERYNVDAIPVKEDKRTLLESIQGCIKDGTVLFPEKGSEELERQLLNFGAVKHDDLCDSLTMGVRTIIEMDHEKASCGVGCVLNNGDIMINGVVTAQAKYYYLNGYHTEPIEEYYRRLQKLNDEGCFL